MDIIGANFDNGVINLMAIQFGMFLGILVIALIAIVILFKVLKVPNKIARPIASLVFLIITYNIFKLVIS
ncbi:hypothetical protein [Rummeliibacillus pycnus]|uniref:hypothetical protein n=1 Tax=Rummeliibacillus pycnus TaxID=101070 RepID=UPI0037CA6E38